MPKSHWSSQFAFILASTASAVGVGNIWRFSYVAGENGGGTFILAYLLLVFLIGLPVLLLEFITGNRLEKTALAAFRTINKGIFPLAYIPMLLNVIIGSYYVVIVGWTLFYFLSSIGGLFIPFSDFSSTYLSLVFTIIVCSILFLVDRLDIKVGLEKVNLYLMPLLFICMVVLLINSMMNLDFKAALEFYTKVDWKELLNPKILIAAASQVIFSLGVGYGIMLTYASYSKAQHNILKSALAVSIGDTAIALISGLVVFSIVFFYNIDPASGPSLAFEALPHAFLNMPFGQLLLAVFFFILFAAALTSAISIAELLTTNIMDTSGYPRERSTSIAVILLLLLSIPSALSYALPHISVFGKPFLDFMDGVITEKFAPFAIFVTVVYISHSYKGLENAVKEEIPGIFVEPLLIMLRYIIPLFLLILFLTQILS